LGSRRIDERPVCPRFRHPPALVQAKFQFPQTGIRYSYWYTLFLIVAEMTHYFPRSNMSTAPHYLIDTAYL
jgi:hypothetical protein